MKLKEVKIGLSYTIPHPMNRFGNFKPEVGAIVVMEENETMANAEAFTASVKQVLDKFSVELCELALENKLIDGTNKQDSVSGSGND